MIVCEMLTFMIILRLLQHVCTNHCVAPQIILKMNHDMRSYLIRSTQTIVRMRGPAILTLMSLLLLNVGAQPLAGSYPKTLDCKGEVSVNQDDSGTTLTCGDGNTVRLRTIPTRHWQTQYLI